MKALTIVLVSIVLGAALGIGVAWANFHGSPPLIVTARHAAPRVATAKGVPKVLVNSRFHDFGAVEDGSKVFHVFKITNLGNAPLTLEAGTTTCTRCTIAEVETPLLQPGETGGVRIEYLPTRRQRKFRQHATVVTNDPDHEIVELNIFGLVTSQFDIEPPYLVLSRISAKETKTAEIRIYDLMSTEVGVEKYEFIGESTAKYFEAAIEPIPADQLSKRHARSGCRVLVTVKPGLPVGPIRQTIRLEITGGGRDNNLLADVTIEGSVENDISIVGRGWNTDAGRLVIGAVESRQGAKRNLFLVLRGPYRNDTIVKPIEIKPSWLKVSVGEPKELKTGADPGAGVTQIPLTIEIPPGAPTVNHLGSDQGEYGQVMLETTHPEVGRIRMYIQFVVLQ
jgi:hypothetical protein